MLQILTLDNNGQKIYSDRNSSFGENIEHKTVAWDSIDEKCDLVILNSGLEVTEGWIEALTQGASSYINVGTVSPMTLQDFRKSAEDKFVEYNSRRTISEWGEILQACALEICHDVEWNLFDCVYIKSEVLCDVGIPTQEIVSDENKAKKWFLTVSQLGWLNVMVTSAMISDDLQYGEESDYYSLRARDEMLKAIEDLWKCIDLYFSLHFDNNRTNILHYSFADFQEGMAYNVGGTQLHISDMVEYQKNKYNVFVLARDGEYLRLTEYVNNDKKQFDFWVGAVKDNSIFFDKIHEELYKKILKVFDIRLIHIHHTMWMPLSIYYVANLYHIPIFLTFHDYYYCCPFIKMINLDNKLCTKQTCESDCKECLEKRKNVVDGIAYITKWHKECGKVIDLCSQVIFPSNRALEVIREFYPQVIDKAIVIEHGVRLPEVMHNINYKHDKLRVAFIGDISNYKGGFEIYNLIQRDRSQFEWYIMGGIGYPDLVDFEQENLTKTGWYKHYEIYDLLKLHEIDIVCILSIFEETFCYTLSEAIAMGIPVIVKRVGALGDRTEKMQCGWVIPRDADADEIYALLCKINNNREEYNLMKDKINSLYNRNIEDMGKEYDEVYQLIHAKRRIQKLQLMLGYVHSNKEEFEDNSEYRLEDISRLEEAEKELNHVKSLYLVQLVLKIYRLDNPFWQRIKRIAKRILPRSSNIL